MLLTCKVSGEDRRGEGKDEVLVAEDMICMGVVVGLEMKLMTLK